MARFRAALFALGMMVVLLMLGDPVRARAVEGQQRDLFDQLLHKYLPGYAAGGEALQWSVHPLPRQVRWKRQNSPISLLPTAAAGGGDEDIPTAPPVSLAGLMGTNAGNAVPASVLAAAASPAQTVSGSTADAATGSDRSAASTTPSTSSSPASASASASSSVAPTSSAVPLSRLITSASSTPASTSTASTSGSTTASPTPTKDAQQSDRSAASASLLSPKNKLFPLIVAGLACAGILAIMLLIAIARAIAHDQLRRDNLRKSYAFPSPAGAEKDGKGEGDRFTSAPAGVRSVRRALTKKKLGSFARRTQDGSVLIEVGDEVFAVPPHLADSYRERILRERRSRSDLSSTDASGGGLFGNVKPRFLSDGGPDVDEEQARAAYDTMLEGGRDDRAPGVGRSLSQRITDRLRSLTGAANETKDTADRNAFSFNTAGQPHGAMRQANLASRTPVITNAPSAWTIQPSRAELHKTPHHANGEGFGTAKVFPRTSSHLPPTSTTNTTKPTGEKVAQPAVAHVKPQQRKPPPKLELTLLTAKLQDLEKQSSSSSASSSLSVDASASKRTKGRLPKEASLTHSQPSSAASANGTFGGSASDVSSTLPGAFPERTKSLLQPQAGAARRARSIKPLILNMEASGTGSTQKAVGGYRHRQPTSAQRSHTQIQHDRAARPTQLERKRTSVPLASPTRFTHEPSPRAIVHPAKPEPSATPGAFRPLPVPPPFHLPK